MPYRADNRQWLTRVVATRKPVWDRETRTWLIPRAAAERVFAAATDEGRAAVLTREFKPDTEKCTEPCQSARLETVNECTCICGGRYHGQRSPGWVEVGRDLLVRQRGDLLVQRRTNGLS